MISTAFGVGYIFLEIVKNTCLRAKNVLDHAPPINPHPLPVGTY